jgi:heme/copper-type cytochrome/quinol oxidase subunit 3
MISMIRCVIELLRICGDGEAPGGGLENMETGAAFWHMIDLIWVLLYPLVYLLR